MCPVREFEELFEERVKESWEKVLGWRARYFKFRDVLGMLYTAIRLKRQPDRLTTVYMREIINVYLSEKNFADAKRDWRRQQELTRPK